MNKLRVYKYDSTQELNGYRGEELTAYLLQGSVITEKLNNELDLAEITLSGLPFQSEFTPQTKFVIDVLSGDYEIFYEDDNVIEVIQKTFRENFDGLNQVVITRTGYREWEINGSTQSVSVDNKTFLNSLGVYVKNYSLGVGSSFSFIIIYPQVIETLHRIVQNDIVEKPVLSNDNYFNHHIFLIEPSAIAQQRIVDNIAVTYKLKDVSLETKSKYPSNQEFDFMYTQSAYTPPFTFVNEFPERGFGKITNNLGKYFDINKNELIYGSISSTVGSKNSKYIDLSPEIDDGSGTLVPNPYKVGDDYFIRFFIPKFKIFGSVLNSNEFSEIGLASINVNVVGKNIITGEIVLEQSKKIITNSDFSVWNYYCTTIPTLYSGGVEKNFDGSWCVEDHKYKTTVAVTREETKIRKYSDLSSNDPYQSPTQENNNYLDIKVQPNVEYSISISLYDFNDEFSGNGYVDQTGNSISVLSTKTPTKSSASGYKNYFIYLDDYFNTTSFIGTETTAIATFQTYDLESKSIFLTSGKPYSALALVQKAILSANCYEKENGVAISNINAMKLPFYIADSAIDKLAQTEIVENFYTQKNLWEILTEVGYYIHAIPEIKFGKDDRLEISFNELGRTDRPENNGTKINITNFRGIEDYISSTSSYITNMVQLGGTITEYVPAKTVAEDFIVNEEKTVIISSKSIIELLKLEVCYPQKVPTYNGDNRNTEQLNSYYDMTEYIFEKNVYSLLGVKYDEFPNRGCSLWYELGSNEIKGGDYQLPTVQPGTAQADYAIKKAIFFSIFGASTDNDENYGWRDIYPANAIFRITYRTKDSVRQEHSRPDLRKYLLNSKYDTAPEHRQFNNQQDVVVDSIKFGNNMYGKLIRTGNTNYTAEEWNKDMSQVKHKGELYEINNDLYYVSVVKHAIFSDYVVSTVEYSKDYNQLSQVIGIPSEPRFYEISEQSAIRRDVAIKDYLLLTSDENKLFMQGDQDAMSTNLLRLDGIKQILFDEQGEFAQYMHIAFKEDRDNTTSGELGLGGADTREEWVDNEKYPTPYDENGNTVEIDTSKTLYEVLLPVNAYSSQNTLTYAVDLKDNYSAGDRSNEIKIDNVSRYQRTLSAVKYVDEYGKSPLFDFYLLRDFPQFAVGEVRALPNSPITEKLGFINGAIVKEFDITTGIKIAFDKEVWKTVIENSGTYQFDYITNSGWELDGQVVSLKTYGIETLEPLTATTGYTIRVVYNTSGTNSVAEFTDNIFATNVKCDKVVNKQTLSLSGNDKIESDGYYADYFGRGKALYKDNREVISLNYNIELLTDSDKFVLSPFVFQPRKQNVRVVFSNKEVNKINSGYVSVDDLVVVRDVNGNIIEGQLNENGANIGFEPSVETLGYNTYYYGDEILRTDKIRLNLFSSKVLRQISDSHFNGNPEYPQIRSVILVANTPIGGDLSFNAYALQFVLAQNFNPAQDTLINLSFTAESPDFSAKMISPQEWETSARYYSIDNNLTGKYIFEYKYLQFYNEPDWSLSKDGVLVDEPINPQEFGIEVSGTVSIGDKIVVDYTAPQEDYLKDWYIGIPKKSLFREKQ